MANHEKNEGVGAQEAASGSGKWLGLHGGGPKHEYPKGEPRIPKNLARRIKHFDAVQSSYKGYTRPGSMKK